MKHIKTLKLAAVITFLKLSGIATAIASQPSLDALTPRPGDTTKYSDLSTIKKLPNITIETGIADIIKTILQLSMALALIALLFVGIYFLKSRGEDEDTGKAKKMLQYLLIGMLVIASAYGIVSGISQFNFFKAA